MKLLTSFLALSFLLPCAALAQEITEQPICFTIRNTADHKVYGEIRTDYVTRPDGQKIRHTGTFRLEAVDTLHPEKGYPMDITEFCSSGPFYPGRQLELILRTLVPIFSCKTSIEAGEVIIQSNVMEKDGTEIRKIWATCL